jgi:hypothetical protein
MVPRRSHAISFGLDKQLYVGALLGCITYNPATLVRPRYTSVTSDKAVCPLPPSFHDDLVGIGASLTLCPAVPIVGKHLRMRHLFRCTMGYGHDYTSQLNQ